MNQPIPIPSAEALAHQTLGSIRTAHAFQKIGAHVSTVQIKQLKESDAWKVITHGINGEILNGTFDDFCSKALGMSPTTVYENIRNLDSFGEEPLEAIKNMGVGFRDLRPLRKLPEEQKSMLIEAAQSGDKAEFEKLRVKFLEKLREENEKNQELKRRNDALNEVNKAQRNKVYKLEAEIESQRQSLAVVPEARAEHLVDTDEERMAYLAATVDTAIQNLKSFATFHDFDANYYLLNILKNNGIHIKAGTEKPSWLQETSD